MAINCELVASEELKRLRDIQRLLRGLCVALGVNISSLGLEEIL